MSVIDGVISKVLFYNKDNGYTVASFLLDFDSIKENKDQKFHSSKIPVLGILDREPLEDERYTLTGEFFKDSKYGLEFKFKAFQRNVFKTKEGLIAYLSSNAFRGIGDKIARKIVDKLGLDALDLIKRDPTCLNGLKLSALQKRVIIEGITGNNDLEQASIFLLSHGLTIEMANKIIKYLENQNVVEVVSNNPYILIDKIPRFGFIKADALATNLGISPTSDVRIYALIKYVLSDLLYSTGNSYINMSTLISGVEKYLQQNIDTVFFSNIISQLVIDHKIYVDSDHNVYDYDIYMAEVALAKEVVLLLKEQRDTNKPLTHYNKEQIHACFNIIKEKSNITFNAEQVDAIINAFTEPLVIITGGPGTGKTTIIHAVLKMYMLLNGDNPILSESIALLAPTGRAAKRLNEATNMKAQTIHKFLGYTGENRFVYNKYNPTDARLIIVDEASMMDLPLASRLVTSMRSDARLIIVGDVDQLPSVGPGQVLKDLIDTSIIKTIRLTHIHRQAENSSIISLARNVNEGMLPLNLMDKLSDRRFLNVKKEMLSTLTVDLYLKILEKTKSIKDIELLIPMYKCPSGINELNSLIQDKVNPVGENNELRYFNKVYRIGDKVIQLVNRPDKNIMNGDIGYIDSFTYKEDKINGLKVLFDTEIITYELDEVEELNLAYAVSIHKAQGSEFDYVIMPFSSSYYVMLQRKLIYTGITRAKKILFLIGDPYVLKTGVSRIEAERNTILKDKIIEYFYNSDINEKIKELESKFEENQNNNMLDDDILGAREISLDDDYNE